VADQPGSTERNWIAAQSSTVALAPVRMPDGRTALASAGSGGVLLHDLDGQLLLDVSAGTGATWLGGTVATGWGGQSLVLGDHKGGIHLVDPGTGRTVRRIAGHRGGVEVATVGTLGDGRPALVTAGRDNVIRVWDPATGARVHRLYGHRTRIRGLAVVDQGDGLPNWLASAEQSGRILIWNLATGRQTHHQVSAPAEVNALAFWRVSNVDLVLAWAAGRTVGLWDVLRHEPIRDLAGHAGTVRALTLVPTPDGPVLASGDMDRTVRLWNPTTGDLIGELAGHERGIWSLAVLRDPDGQVLLASGSDAVRL
jgi:WD40 repeat protein